MTSLNNSDGGWKDGFYNLSESTSGKTQLKPGDTVSLKKTLVPGNQPWYRVHSIDFNLEMFQVELCDRTVYPIAFSFDDIKNIK